MMGDDNIETPTASREDVGLIRINTPRARREKERAAKRAETEEAELPWENVVKKEQPKPEPEPETVRIPEGGWDVNVLREILAVPKTKDSIPTLTCIDKGVYKRYFIIDVDGDAYRRAWEYYRSTKKEATPDDFVTIVLRILQQDMPRMYRAVSYVPLL